MSTLCAINSLLVNVLGIMYLSCKTTAQINENDQIFGDSACQIDRDHQDHTAFGIEMDQNLRFPKG